MSDTNTLSALRTLLLATTITDIKSSDISFIDPPEAFQPEGKQIWIDEDFLPASSESTGKTKASSNEDRGIYQLTVYIPLLKGDYGVSLSTAVDEIKAGFFYGETTEHNNQKVDILEVVAQGVTSAVAQGVTSNDAWSRRVITINYLTFSDK